MTQPKDWRFGKHIMAEDRVERRLAAILAADVAGYSRLMGADEEGTLAALKAHRRAVLDPKITEHRESSRPPATGCSSSLPVLSMRCAARSICSARWPSATRASRRNSASNSASD